MTTTDIHTLTGAYVLDAVSDVERRAFENHMVTCPACADEVRELRETTARLAGAAATSAPPTLWLSVRGMTPNVRQLPPRLPNPPPDKRGWRTRITAGIVAAGVAAAVSFGIAWHNQANRLDGEIAQNQSQLDRINTILSAPDARTVHGADGTLTIVMSRSANGMVITAHDLRAPAPSESLEAWSVTAGRQKIPLGLLDSSAGTILVPDLNRAGDISYVAVTLEPRGGSLTPSSHIVATATVT